MASRTGSKSSLPNILITIFSKWGFFGGEGYCQSLWFHHVFYFSFSHLFLFIFGDIKGFCLLLLTFSSLSSPVLRLLFVRRIHMVRYSREIISQNKKRIVLSLFLFSHVMGFLFELAFGGVPTVCVFRYI